jgi:hypothetical protein
MRNTERSRRVVVRFESQGAYNRVVRPSFIKFLARRAWQRFLGKLLLARAEESNTVGILVALNAVNGNVAGSYASLRKHDSAVFVIEGKDLLARAIESGEAGKEDAVRKPSRTSSVRSRVGWGRASDTARRRRITSLPETARTTLKSEEPD